MAVVIGVDLGTQSCKAVVCDERLAVLADHNVAVETIRPDSDRAEQDPADWDRALTQAVAGALAAARVSGTDVVALAIAGQLDGCVPVNERGLASHRALIWQDRRAIPEAALAPRELVHRITGQVADPSHMAPKIRWLREHAGPAARWHQPVSYLVERLVGVAVLDPAHASTTMLFDLAAGTWSDDLLARFAIRRDELPAIRPAHSIAGTLREPLAGIPAGIPVAVGTGDDFATPLGAGLVAPGTMICALGTAEVVGALATAPILDVPAARGASDPWRALAEPMVETHAYPTGAYFIENPGWLSGGAVRWATRLLGLEADAELDALAASAPPGADGLTFTPALAGAMTPTWQPAARAGLHGLTAAHDRPHVARAVLEGLAFACRDVAERLTALGVISAARTAAAAPAVHLLGGGSRSAVWTQIRADALGLPHHVAARTDTCAVGAAMLAAVAVGLVPDLTAACALVPPPARTVLPQRDLDEAYARYRQLADPSRIPGIA
jgi:xylulokinase